MKKRNRYAKASTAGRWSGTRRACVKRQVLCALGCFVLCALAAYAGFHNIAKTEKKTIVLPTPTPTVAVTDLRGRETELATPYRLVTDRYAGSSSPEDTWMEDFDDTRTPRTVKGLYLTADALNKKFDEILEIIDNTAVNAVVIDLKGDNGAITASVESELLRAKGYTDLNLIPNLTMLLSKLKARNIYCIARIVCFRDSRTAQKTPSYALKLGDGTVAKDKSGYAWLDPFNEDVWEFLTEIGREAARMGFDEVNFDYFGFSTDNTIKLAKYGKSLTKENKQAAVTGFVRYACEQLKPLGLFVSADVYGIVMSSDTDAAAVGQNYAELSRYLDYICPMVYPSSYSNGYYNLKVPDAQPYELIYNAMRDSKKALAANMAKGRCAGVRPWLQAFTATWLTGHVEYGVKAMNAQIRGTYDAGYDGWLLWNTSGAYAVFRDALGSAADKE